MLPHSPRRRRHPFVGWSWVILPWCLSCGGSAGAGAKGADAEGSEGAGDGREAVDVCPDIASCESACERDDAAGCEYAGRMYETGEGAAQDYEKAAERYDQACRGGREGACAHLAMMYDIGLAVEEDPKRAHELYEKACAQGNRWACKRGAQLE